MFLVFVLLPEQEQEVCEVCLCIKPLVLCVVVLLDCVVVPLVLGNVVGLASHKSAPGLTRVLSS